MLGGHGVCPSLDSGPGDLDGGTAGTAHQVVVMLAAALAVHGLALVVDEEVDLTGCRQ